MASAQQKANYQLAEKFRLLTQNPIMKYSTEVNPTFINDTDCFYYSFTTREGEKYYYVNPKKKEKRLLFDTPELLSKIAVYTKKAYSAAAPHLSFTFMKDNETIRLDFDRGLYTYNIRTKVLKKLDEKPIYKDGDPYWKKYSPDSLYMLYASKDNLYFVGNPKKGQDTIPVQLTTDGGPDYTFNREDEGKMEGRFGAESAHWLPGTHRFYAVREDNRKVRDLWLINSLSKFPELTTYKAELAGDKDVTQYELLLGDVDKREVKKVDINRWPDQYIDVLYTTNDGKRLYFQRYNRSWNQSDICEVDVETGQVRVVIHEENKPYLDYQMRSVSFLKDGKEILFRSERNGWGHYYLYDTATGNLKNQVTDGTWVAGPIAKIDTVGRKFYFYGYGREKSIDPYYYILYEAKLDQLNAIRLLTPENASHEARISPSNHYIVDSYSTVSQEPVNVVRNSRGKVVMKLEKPDLQPVYEMGWKALERFKVKAADGVTDLYGVMWKPADFDSTKVYPIISNVYPGPFFEYVPTRFTVNDVYNTRLAQLGFIVITVGHRGGTPMRGKAYHTYGYNNMRDYPLADDKYAIEQLAARYPFIDGTKVGIYGHSGGGFMSAAAICTYPDFYSAAVSSAGNHDNRIYNKGFVEIHFGVDEKVKTGKDSLGVEHTTYDYSVRVRPNQELAKNYKHGLLLFTGAVDNTVNPANTLRLVHALIKADKDFDMFVLPKCTHGFFGESEVFFEHKMWRHFARLLLNDHSADADIDLNKYMIEDERRR
ncbi:Dipeptidyl peptidase IV (DPP IV) N-terminal region./Prolyl oligopeptidase family [Bacteroides xylanisolvens XB1A]|uniref:Dipeptidyl peptidase IV (DPP IV) N-terminal region./Prolyl oligopeptidase family n=2 Tax=Bacteroides xylanisolvens TaxID=371601 RepID=D6CZ72_9BACE|nr:Dipeptidyl peptidase IV (DPP IV) N-terminal region./Prolyl oligopeptidase family [Bacteroides xylanisolvens XB1A]